eukprot:6030699-Pyramimonas_sp.AAC.1
METSAEWTACEQEQGEQGWSGIACRKSVIGASEVFPQKYHTARLGVRSVAIMLVNYMYYAAEPILTSRAPD